MIFMYGYLYPGKTSIDYTMFKLVDDIGSVETCGEILK